MNLGHVLVRLGQSLPHCLPERTHGNHASPVRHDLPVCQLRPRVEHDTPLHVRYTRDLLSFLDNPRDTPEKQASRSYRNDHPVQTPPVPAPLWPSPRKRQNIRFQSRHHHFRLRITHTHVILDHVRITTNIH